MTTKLTISRFRTRKPDPVAHKPYAVQGNAALAEPVFRVADNPFMPEDEDDGFSGQTFLPPQPPASAALSPDASPPEEIDAIRREGLTGRQLRVARRMAQKHDLPATSDFDAVRLLRRAGIDPFGRSAVLELVQGNGEYDPDDLPAVSDGTSHALALTVDKLPQTVTIQFPDPWFKKKHAKRRMVNAELVASVVNRLSDDGRIFVQTDIEFLADEMFDLFRRDDRLTFDELTENPFPIKTEREKAVEDKGLSVYRALFQKTKKEAG